MHSLARAAPATAYQLNIAVSVNQHHALFLSTCTDLLIYILVTFVMPFVTKHISFIHVILFRYSIFIYSDCYCGKSRKIYQRQNNYFYHCLKRRKNYDHSIESSIVHVYRHLSCTSQYEMLRSSGEVNPMLNVLITSLTEEQQRVVYTHSIATSSILFQKPPRNPGY